MNGLLEVAPLSAWSPWRTNFVRWPLKILAPHYGNCCMSPPPRAPRILLGSYIFVWQIVHPCSVHILYVQLCTRVQCTFCTYNCAPVFSAHSVPTIRYFGTNVHLSTEIIKILRYCRRGSSVSIVSVLRAARYGVQFPARENVFSSPKRHWGFTLPPILWVLGWKWLGREADRSSESNTEV